MIGASGEEEVSPIIQGTEGHVEEDVVEGHSIHLILWTRVLRNTRTWKVAEGLVETKEEGDLIVDRDDLEEAEVSFYRICLERVEQHCHLD